MNVHEARTLTPGDRVMFGGDPKDDGTVKAVNGDAIVIRWRGDATDSYHHADKMGQIERRPARARRA